MVRLSTQDDTQGGGDVIIMQMIINIKRFRFDLKYLQFNFFALFCASFQGVEIFKFIYLTFLY